MKKGRQQLPRCLYCNAAITTKDAASVQEKLCAAGKEARYICPGCTDLWLGLLGKEERRLQLAKRRRWLTQEDPTPVPVYVPKKRMNLSVVQTGGFW